MRKFSALLLAMLVSTALNANPPLSVSLPPVEYFDCETETNVLFTVGHSLPSRFTFSLECRATPSNNVEVAFGIDQDGNGKLDLKEIDLLAGWDRGAWFIRHGVEGERHEVPSPTTNDVKRLEWTLRLSSTRCDVLCDGRPVFPDLRVENNDWLYDSSWNCVRLVGRGLDSSRESFSFRIGPDSTVIYYR